ncbi:MAG: lysophospholipase L1-like esterase [Chlamydiales bacterium]|jgi:lysophospholipase L1-like esterase
MSDEPDAGTPRRKRLGLRKGLAVSLAVSVLIVTATEIGFRVAGYAKGPAMYYDPQVGSRFHPNQTRTIDVRHGKALIELELNSMGLRGPTPERTPGTPRVACIGDSFTFGWGVQGDETYPVALAQVLAADPDLMGAEVLNFGIPGYNTWNELQAYRHVVRPHAPDVVIIGFYPNDVKPDSGGTALDEYRALRWLTRITPALAEGLRRHVLAKMEVGKPHVPAATREQLAQWRKTQLEMIAQPGDPLWSGMWDTCMAELDTLVEEVRADGATPLIVLFPTPTQVAEYDALQADPTDPEGATTEIERLVLEHARATGTHFVTLLPDFANSASAPFGEFHRTHPSVHGYRISAERIAQALADLD